MSENEDFEALKVIELQNELKKRGLDTKGRKADLIARLREAISAGTEVANPEPSEDESTPAVIKDETSSPSSPIEDDDEDDVQEQSQPQPMEEPLPSVMPSEETDSTLTKKRSLDENDNDDSEKVTRKKKSRWGAEEEPEEKRAATKPASEEEENISLNRDYRRSERSAEKEVLLPEEETVQFNPDDVVLDFYTSDLNLTINSECLSARTKSNDAFCFLWAGARTTYGFQQGRICYETRITEILDCSNLPDAEKDKFGVRIGWSNLSSGLHALQLGEINDSFAYASNGTKLSNTNDRFSEETYGESFGLSDVIGCYLDFEENALRISFTKNGNDCGQAFEIEKTNENQSIFYPHILVKNAQVECNFGQRETPWSEMKPDYLFPQAVPLTDRTRSAEPIVEKSSCQVLFLSGLTCSGKTTWANKYIQENPTKNFHLINVESVLHQMSVRPSNRNDSTMLRVNVCLQKLIEIAARRRRNFLIDHVHTTREIQSKRQHLFSGYHRIGVVIIPEEEELRRRVEKVERLENISFPSQWIRDGKSRFHFMQKSSTLEEVIYPELSYEDGRSLYERARRDTDSSRSSSSRYERHDEYRSSRYERSRYEERDRRDRSRSRERRSRERDRDRRSSRDDSRYSSSSRRNESYQGGGYSNYRQDSRNNQQGGGFHGRGGGYNNQWNENSRGGYHQQQRNDYGRGGNQYNNRGSYQENQRGGYRSDFNNRQYDDYENNSRHQGNNSYNQQNDRQGFGSRPSMPQQPPPRSQPLLQTPPSTQQQPPPAVTNPNPPVVTQPSSLDSWFALCAAALKPQAAQPQQDANTLNQWSQWLKTAQMTQAAQQVQPTESQSTAISDATALYYQAYYAQLAAAQQQAAALPPNNEK